MKKYIAAAALALFALSSVPANAAANVAVAGPGAAVYGEYFTPRIVLSKSAPAVFANLDPTAPHDIVSNRKVGTAPAFESDVIGGGRTTPIVIKSGAQPGEYTFYCSLHPTMTGVATLI